jgi:hypothetical protein
MVMQIDRLRTLLIPTDTNPAATDKESQKSARGAERGIGNPTPGVPRALGREDGVPASVVLKLQSESKPAPDSLATEPVVYSVGQRSPFSQSPKPAESRQPDFVSLAVSAMREYADEAERQKRSAPLSRLDAGPAEQPSTTHHIPQGL